MIDVYKFTNPYMTTYDGTFRWRKNHKRVVSKRLRSSVLCSDGVIHAYISPLLAVLMDSVHGGYSFRDGILWEGVTPEIVADDGTKIGVHELTLKRWIEIPTFTQEQRVRFAVLAALGANDDADFVRWAGKWLDGSDSWRTAIDLSPDAPDQFEGPQTSATFAASRAAVALAQDYNVNEWVGQTAANARRANPSLDLVAIAESVHGRTS